MSSPAAAIVNELPRRQAAALKRKVKRLGLTPDSYLKQLIEEDLALDLVAERTSLHELAAPFRKALAAASDAEIDQIVKKARKRVPRSGRGR